MRLMAVGGLIKSTTSACAATTRVKIKSTSALGEMVVVVQVMFEANLRPQSFY